MKNKFKVDNIVCVNNNFSFNPAYKVLSIGRLISLCERKDILETSSIIIYTISGFPLELDEEELKKSNIKTKFKIGDSVEVKDEDGNETIGTIELIHIFRGRGLYVGEDKRGKIAYQIDGDYREYPEKDIIKFK